MTSKKLKAIRLDVINFIEIVPGDGVMLERILTAFVHYRPDLRYVKNMAFLAGTLLNYCDE